MSSLLTDLQNLTVFTKRLSEAHVKMITNFCFIALENVNKVEIDYCVDPTLLFSSEYKNGYIKFIVHKKHNQKSMGNKQRSQNKRLEDIKVWVRSILWNDIDISFYSPRGKKLDVKRNSRKQKISN